MSEPLVLEVDLDPSLLSAKQRPPEEDFPALSQFPFYTVQSSPGACHNGGLRRFNSLDIIIKKTCQTQRQKGRLTLHHQWPIMRYQSPGYHSINHSSPSRRKSLLPDKGGISGETSWRNKENINPQNTKRAKQIPHPRSQYIRGSAASKSSGFG